MFLLHRKKKYSCNSAIVDEKLYFPRWKWQIFMRWPSIENNNIQIIFIIQITKKGNIHKTWSFSMEFFKKLKIFWMRSDNSWWDEHPLKTVIKNKIKCFTSKKKEINLRKWNCLVTKRECFFGQTWWNPKKAPERK